MPTTKRAWLYVTRRRKRTALLFLLFVVLMTGALLGFMLYAASMDAAEALRGSIGGYLTIHAGDGGAWADEALLEQVKTLEDIRAYNGVDTSYLYCEGLSLVPARWYGTGMVGESVPRFIGCTDTALHERFLSSSFQLTEGRQIGPDDEGKAMVSKDIAEKNGLAVGDTLAAEVVPGVRDWPEDTAGFRIEFEIVGIYAATRSEPVTPTMEECDLQENIVFMDIQSAKRLQRVRSPSLTGEGFRYGSGIMLFPNDPAKMAETVERLKRQVDADWDNLLIFENSAAYRQAAPAIQKAGTFSLLLLAVLFAVSIGVLSLTLTLWTRERLAEIAILISLGISGRGICGQLLLENYLIAAPAFAGSLAVAAALSGRVGSLLGGAAGEVTLNAVPAVAVLACAAAAILVSVLLAALTILRKKPKAILTDLS